VRGLSGLTDYHVHTFRCGHAGGASRVDRVAARLEDGKANGKYAKEKKYAAARVTDDVYLVSYLTASGFTLTVALNFDQHTLTGFASNDKQWFPCSGTFEVVR